MSSATTVNTKTKVLSQTKRKALCSESHPMQDGDPETPTVEKWQHTHQGASSYVSKEEAERLDNYGPQLFFFFQDALFITLGVQGSWWGENFVILCTQQLSPRKLPKWKE